MASHVAYWLASFVIATLCFLKAWKVGANGLDDQGVFKDQSQWNRTEIWTIAGAGLAALAFLDAFMFFNPPPASMR
jgi:hypothetical protein